MKLPESVDILGQDFTIRQDNETLERLGRAGEMLASEHLINYTTAQCLQQLQDTILHECIHAVDAAGDGGTLTEEKTISLTTGLLYLIKRNPKLMKFLTAK